MNAFGVLIVITGDVRISNWYGEIEVEREVMPGKFTIEVVPEEIRLPIAK